MRKILFYGIPLMVVLVLFLLVFPLFICEYFSDKTFISNKKNLEIINGESISEIMIIDKNKKQYVYNVEPEEYYGWTEDFIGDFRFIFIKTGSDIEGIFLITNNYRKKLFLIEVITNEEYRSNINNYGIFDPYRVTIEIIQNKFEIKYDSTKFNVLSYFNYNENYLVKKKKYMIEYNF
jgi:hypothetical protein